MSLFRKKRIKFNVELVVDKLTDVSLLNASLFAKVRLLDCGSFEACTQPRDLRNHVCQLHSPQFSDEKNSVFSFPAESAEPPSPDSEDVENRPEEPTAPIDNRQQPFRFQCRIPYNDNGELEECRCKISIRKQERTGRQPTKLGFVIVNLSEFAASGTTPILQSYLLDGYTGRQRQDNSRVHVAIRMFHQTSDPLFKVPNSASHPVEANSLLNPADRKAPSHLTSTPINGSKHADVAEEVRRRLENPSFDPSISGLEDITCTEIPSSSAATSLAQNMPHSSTHTSFSSSNSDQNPSNPSPPPVNVMSTPANRFSHQLTSERRPSMPISSVDRASWHAGGQNGLTEQQILEMRRNCTMRRMSDDRIVTAQQNVPNRVQQTRRDADSVIEEVLAEAACTQSDTATDDTAFDISTEETDRESDLKYTPKSKRGLALFVSRRNGDVLLTAGSNQSPAPNFERVQLDSTMSG